MVIKCTYCGKEFERSLSHVNLNKKLKRKNYCSKTCRNKAHSKNMSGKNNIMFGIRLSMEAKEKIRSTKVGKKRTPETKEKIRKATTGKNNPNYDNHKLAGKNHPNWKGGVTPKNVRERQDTKNKRFIKDTLKRDDYNCQICGQHGGKLSVDHIMPWALYPKLRRDLDNVRTLCKLCHKEHGANPNCRPIKWASSSVNLPT